MGFEGQLQDRERHLTKCIHNRDLGILVLKKEPLLGLDIKRPNIKQMTSLIKVSS